MPIRSADPSNSTMTLPARAPAHETLGSEASTAGRANRALAFERLRETNHQAPAMAVAFALAAGLGSK